MALFSKIATSIPPQSTFQLMTKLSPTNSLLVHQSPCQTPLIFLLNTDFSARMTYSSKEHRLYQHRRLVTLRWKATTCSLDSVGRIKAASFETNHILASRTGCLRWSGIKTIYRPTVLTSHPGRGKRLEVFIDNPVLLATQDC